MIRRVVEALIVVAMLALTVWGYRECRAQRRCVRNGGEVETYNCQLVYCGDGCFTEWCDWRCVGASAEDGGR